MSDKSSSVFPRSPAAPGQPGGEAAAGGAGGPGRQWKGAPETVAMEGVLPGWLIDLVPGLRMERRLSPPEKNKPHPPETEQSEPGTADAVSAVEANPNPNPNSKPNPAAGESAVSSSPPTSTPASPPAATAGASAEAGSFALTSATQPAWLAAFGLGALGMAGGGGGGDSSSAAPASAPDTTAPQAPVIQAVSTDDRINAAEKSAGVAVSGTAESGASVRISLNGLTQTTTATGGNWSVTFASGDLSADGSFSVSAVAVDAANNASAAASRAVLIDTVAPQIVSMSASSASQTVTLTYDGALDGAQAPLASAFAVTVGGVANAVSGVVVSGSTVTLSLANAFASGMVSVTYTDPAGDAANAIQDAAGNDAPSFTSGVASDGYVRGATVYVDSNGNGVAEAGVDYLVGTTDEDGNFFIPAGAPAGAIIAVGGVNIDTGVANTIALMAPVGSSVINPLTTLVQSLVASSGGALSVSAAAGSVAQSLGLTLPGGQSLLNFDPIAANSPSVQRAAAQVASVVALAAGGDAAAAATVVGNLASQISAASGTIDLSDAGVLAGALAGVNVSLDTQSAIAELASALKAAGSLAAVTAAQAQFLDTLAPAVPTLAIPPLTADTTPNLTVSFNTTAVNGTAAVVNDTVAVFDAGVQIATRTLNAADIAQGSVTLTLPQLAHGAHSLTARLVDQAGNASAASATAAVTVDDVAPLAPVIGMVAQDDILGAAEQASVISGAAEALATLNLQLGAVTRSVAVDAGGLWSYTLTAADLDALGQGSVTLRASATDAAGNTSAEATRSISVDTLAPTATATFTAVTDNVGAVTGNVTAGGTTDDNTLALSGSVSAALGAGESLIVFDGANRLGAATVSGTTWSFSALALANGAHSFTVRVEDAAGNLGPASAAYALTVNATLPGATASITAAVDDVPGGTGDLASGAVSNDAALVLEGAVTGTLADDDKVVIYDGATRLGEAVVSADTWSYQTASLSGGAHAFTAVVENAAGNQGAASAAFAVVIDTSAPASPSVAVVAGDDVINAAETTSLITGLAEAGAAVALTLGSGPTRQVVANAGGVWSYTLVAEDLAAMGQGPQTVSVTATDAAGNTGAATTRAVSVDTVAPGVPGFDVVAGNDVINAQESASLVLSGTTSAGARVDLTLGNASRSVTANGSGVWSLTLFAADIVGLGQGTKTLLASATDAAGNQTAAGSREVLVDTRAPSLSSVNLLPGRRTNDTTPSIQFSAETLAQVEVDWGAGGGWQSAPAGSGALQTLTAPAYGSDGSYTIRVRASDTAGNTSLRALSFELDATAPNPPVISAVAGDDRINAAEKAAGVSVSGTAEAGASVAVTLGSATRTVVATAGAWSVQFNSSDIPADGPALISAVATDSFANASTPGSRALTIDTQAPAAPVISVVEGDDLINTIERADGLTVSGTTAEAGTLTLRLGSSVATISVQGGAWSHTFAAAELPGDGNLTLAATVTDAAGNESAETTRSVLIDSTAPAAPVIAANLAGDDKLNATEAGAGLQVSGTATAAQSVEVVFNGITRAAEVSAGAWSVSFAAGELPSDGGHTLVARAIDAAGNISPDASRQVKVDRVAPDAPVINSVGGNDIINSTEKTAGVTLSGTAEEGATVIVTFGETDARTTVASGGVWSLAYSAGQLPADGTRSVRVTATDAAGNQSAEATRSVLIDSTPSAAPVIGALAGDDKLNAAEAPSGLQVSGTATAAQSVEVVFNGITRAAAVSDGAWSVSFAAGEMPADGDHTLVARAIDAVGNISPDASRQVKVDRIAPDAPVINTVGGNDVINSTEKAAGVTLSGTAEEGATVIVAFGETDARTTVASGGVWSLAYAAGQLPADGTRSLRVTATDAAGNQSAEATRSVLIDTTPPALPVIGAVAVDDQVNAQEKSDGVTLSGSASGAAAVQLTGGGMNRTVTVSEGLWSVSLASADIPADGSVALAAVAIDEHGNASAAASRTVIIDTSPPPAPAISSNLAGDDVVNASEAPSGLEVSGTATAAQSVEVVFNGITRAAAVSAGAWSVSFAAGELPADGAHNVVARAIDAAGNVSAEMTRSLLIDTTAPAVPGIGAVSVDDQINAQEKSAGVTLSGSASGAAAVRITWAGVPRTVAVSEGQWSVSLASADIPADGTHALSAVAIDANGNESAAASRTVTIDSAPPAAPVIAANLAGDDKLNATEAGAGLQVSGTASAAQNVEVVFNGITRTAAVSGGAWSVSFATGELPADGDHTLVARAIDAAGNISSDASRQIRVDRVAPQTPVINTVGGDDIINSTEKTAGVTLSGTAEEGATVTVTFGDTTPRTTVASGGVWSLAYAAGQLPADGTRSLNVTATDAAGNQSAEATRSVLIDSTPPAAPVIAANLAGDDKLNATEAGAELQVSGTATAAQSVEVVFNGITRAAAVSGGAWSVSFAAGELPADGDHTLVARAMDAVGNISPDASRQVKVDRVAPDAPGINTVAEDDIINSTEKTAGVTLSGTAEDGATVTVAFGDTAVRTTVASGGGWSLTYSAGQLPADGTRSLSITATDAAGNVSAEATHSVLIDTTAPPVPSIGVVSVDDQINAQEKDAGVTLSGSASGAAEVQITWGSVTRSASVSEGQWSADFGADEIPADGSTTLAVVAIDEYGNASAAVSKTVIIDTAPPPEPVIAANLSGDDRLNAAEAGSAFLVSGTATAAQSVEVVFNDITRTAAVSGGAWSLSFTSGELPADGEHTLIARAIDVAGNIGAEASRQILLDRVAPDAPGINDVAEDNIISGTEKTDGVTLAGTAEDGTVTVTFGSTAPRTTVASGGEWSLAYTADQLLADGNRSVSVTVTDAAGNVSAAATRSVLIDTTPPTAPVIAVVAGDDRINASEHANDITVAGTAEALAQINLSLGSYENSTTADENGAWSVSISYLDLPGNGSSTLTVGAVDALGNVSSNATRTLTVDTVTPTLVSASVNGATLTLNYDEPLDAAHPPNLAAFLVSVSGVLRGVSAVAVSGSAVQLTLTSAVQNGDEVSLSFLEAEGDDAYTVQDAAGNDVAALSDIAVTNLTAAPGADATAPSLVAARVDASFSEIPSTITLDFNETMQTAGSGGLPSITRNGVSDAINLSAQSASGKGVTLELDVPLSSSDWVVISNPVSSRLQDAAGNAYAKTTLVVGSAGADTLDLSAAGLAGGILVRANDGDDAITATEFADTLVGGAGGDVIRARGGADRVFLTDPDSRAQDVVVIGAEDESTANQLDLIYGFDTLVADINDVLRLPGGDIAANTAGWVDGVNQTGLMSHRITSGIIEFGASDTGGAVLIASGSNFSAALDYLQHNLTTRGQTVGFAVDTDNNGAADSLCIFQAQESSFNDVVVSLRGVVGATLSNTAGGNVVQVVDGVGPAVAGLDLDGSDLLFTFDENVASADFAGLGITLVSGGVSTALSPTLGTVSGTSPLVTLALGSTPAAGDHLLLMPNDRAHQHTTDGAGNFARLFEAASDGIALGLAGDTVIDLSAISGRVDIFDIGGGDDTLTGNDWNNEIFGGSGRDILNGGGGADILTGGEGADILQGSSGGDTYLQGTGDAAAVSYQDAGSSGLGAGDTFTFSAGTDVYSGLMTGDTIKILPSGQDPEPTQETLPASGLVSDQRFALIQGNWNGSGGGTFTFDTSGPDTLVLFDDDTSVGSVAQHALVLSGVGAAEFSVQNNQIVIL